MSFFFSSRRRHTRWPRDWSSDVCSSDLWSRGPGPRRDAPASRSRRRATPRTGRSEIGRASCRERVEVSVVGVAGKEKQESGEEHEAVEKLEEAEETRKKEDIGTGVTARP